MSSVLSSTEAGAIYYLACGFNVAALCSTVLQQHEGLVTPLTASPALAWETKSRSGLNVKQAEPRLLGFGCCYYLFLKEAWTDKSGDGT